MSQTCRQCWLVEQAWVDDRSCVLFAATLQERVRIEAEALQEQAKHCPEHVPELYHFDAQVR